MQEICSSGSEIERLTLSDLSAVPHLFFELLPDYWQVDIIPCWTEYSASARILCLVSGDRPIAGGVLFHAETAETSMYGQISATLFQHGGLYVAYLWVLPEYRGMKLGSRWLEAVKQRYPGQLLWLAIDDPQLGRFYRNNGFYEFAQVQFEGGQDRLFISGTSLVTSEAIQLSLKSSGSLSKGLTPGGLKSPHRSIT